MVRKIIISFCVLAVVLCFSMPTQAASYNPDDFDYSRYLDNEIFKYNIDIKVLNWAESIINSLPIGFDYIFTVDYREEDVYYYTLIVSDDFKVEPSDSAYSCITSENTIIHQYELPLPNDERLPFVSWFDGSIYIETERYGMLSSLFDFPDLIERSYYAETLNTILLCVLLLSFVLNCFFRSR